MTHCKEEDLYLYDELDADVRKAVDSHVATCPACSALLNQVRVGQQTIRKVAADVPQPANASALTSRIIAKVSPEGATQATMSGWLDRMWVRWAMVATSLLLTVGFVYEQQMQATLSPHRPAAVGVVALQTKTLRQWQQNRQRKEAYSLYACAQSLYCDNVLINTYKSKKETW